MNLRTIEKCNLLVLNTQSCLQTDSLDRQTDRQTDRQRDRLVAYNCVSSAVSWSTSGTKMCLRLTDRQTDRETDRETDKQRLVAYNCVTSATRWSTSWTKMSFRLTDRQTDIQTDRQSDLWLTTASVLLLDGRRLELRCALDLQTDTSSRPTARTTAFRSASSVYSDTHTQSINQSNLLNKRTIRPLTLQVTNNS